MQAHTIGGVMLTQDPGGQPMHKSLVSVIVPVYNGARYLRQALDSALAQTYPNLEVVVIDDGSTDTSREVIASYGPRLGVIEQANSGVAVARNAGIRASRGEFISFLDQDDWWHPQKIARQVEVLQADAAVALVHTDLCHYDEVSGQLVPRCNSGRPDLLSGSCYERLLHGNAICNSTVMVRRAVLDEVGLLDTTMGRNTVQDYDLWLRIAKRWKLAYIEEKLITYRFHPNQGMWNLRPYLGDELRVLEKAVGDRNWFGSPSLRMRVAQLLDQLGVSHMDAREHALARACFARAMRTHWSARACMLYLASFLPPYALSCVRWSRTSLRRERPVASEHVVPAWAAEATNGYVLTERKS